MTQGSRRWSIVPACVVIVAMTAVLLVFSMLANRDPATNG